MNWKKAYLENRVLSAGPVELINILYEYAMLSVQDARSALNHRDIGARAKAISKAIAILGELESSLDHELGGAIAANLARLYRYMRERLTLANLQQTDQPLAEVETLLKTLGEAWQQIGQEKPAASEDIRQERIPTGWGVPSPSMMESIVGHSSQSWSV